MKSGHARTLRFRERSHEFIVECTPDGPQVLTHPAGRDVASLDRGGDRKNLLVDGGAQILWQKLRVFEVLPRGDGALRRLDRDLPQRACGNPGPVGKAPHLSRRDFGQAAAAAETQGERVAANIRQRRHK